jgi:peptide deformylase
MRTFVQGVEVEDYPEVPPQTLRGTALRVTEVGEEVLHRRNAEVTEEMFGSERLRTLVDDMFTTMAVAEGVGLAANQVGMDLAVFVYDCPDQDHQRHAGVICNPVVTLPEGKDRRLDKADEGCLSLPGAYSELARPDHAVCRGVDAYGDEVEVVGTGLLARCLQHETDHLNGMVFGDRLAARARKRLYQLHEEIADLYPYDWPVSPRLDDDAEDDPED